jgi:folate-dependent phosphoribosylglycinamide formyltransferase PurN
MSSLRVVVLCCDGLFQRYLAARAGAEFTLAGVVVQSAPAHPGGLAGRLARYANPAVLLRHAQARLLLPAYERRCKPLLRELFFADGRAPRFPQDAPKLVTSNINSDETAAFIQRQKPDIVLVNGTNLLRAPLLSLAAQIPLGIINLHTGLSPYARGGNCNLYMLLENRPELVGVTVHHIDAGIDSGDIVLTAQVPMQPGDTYEMIDARSFHLGIGMLLRAARLLHEGRAARVAQWEQGKLFLKRTGYRYEPYQRLLANRLLARGMVRDYLNDKAMRDAGVRLVQGPP